MNKLFFTAGILFMIFVCSNGNAQTKNSTLSGKVTSFEESLGLEGVSIQVKGTNKSSGTQADGTYSIVITPADKTLLFILEGYQTQELDLPSKKGYDVVLKRNGNSISLDFVFPFSQNAAPVL